MNYVCIEITFPLGHVGITLTARDKLNQEDVVQALRRHARGDWGDGGKADAAENDLSLKEGFRLLSVYHDRNRIKFWILTEADRSATNVKLHISSLMLSLQKC